MSLPWTCAKCDRPILKGQPFTTAIVPGRSPKPGVVSGKVLVHKNEEDCKKPPAPAPSSLAGVGFRGD